jgi:hypothetical protein
MQILKTTNRTNHTNGDGQEKKIIEMKMKEKKTGQAEERWGRMAADTLFSFRPFSFLLSSFLRQVARGKIRKRE